MSNDSFEIMKIWIPLGADRSDIRITPINDPNTEKEWKKASELAKDGWELIGAIPISAAQGGYSFTLGYTLLFKRRIQP